MPDVLGPLERRIMAHVWQSGPSTVAQARDALNKASSQQLAYTTVMTILQRLDRKGVVTRRREGRMHVYAPVWSREEYREARAQVEVDDLVARFGESALVQFARQMDGLDRKRLDELRRLARRA